MATVIPLPRQERSRRTLDRLLDSAEKVLSEKGFDAATAAEIAAAAGFTVGAFYARFPTKEAVWVGLLERARAAIQADLAGLDDLDPGAVGPEEAVSRLVATLAGMYERHRDLARAIRSPSRLGPELAGRLRAMNAETLGTMESFLGRWKAQVGHPEPGRAIEMAVFMLAMTLRELLLIQQIRTGTRRWSRKRIVRETSRALAAYLEVRGR